MLGEYEGAGKLSRQNAKTPKQSLLNSDSSKRFDKTVANHTVLPNPAATDRAPVSGHLGIFLQDAGGLLRHQRAGRYFISLSSRFKRFTHLIAVARRFVALHFRSSQTCAFLTTSSIPP